MKGLGIGVELYYKQRTPQQYRPLVYLDSNDHVRLNGHTKTRIT